MSKFHAVMKDECGNELMAEVDARCKFDARRKLADKYPDMRLLDLKSNLEMYHRQRRFERAAQLDYDNGGDY
jgi:hypothetical protein